MMQRIILVTALALLAGCSSTNFYNDVTSIADNSITGCCTFAVLPADENVDQASLAWRRLEGQLVRALENQGFSKVASDEIPDIGILAVVGIGDPRSENFSVPMWGQTGTTTTGSTTTGTVNVFGNTASVNSNTTYNAMPTYGIVGSMQGTRTVYDRYLALHAYSLNDKTEFGDYLEAWSTIIRSSGSSGDLSVVLPYMIAAGQPYLGKNLAAQKRVVLPENSQKVKAILE